MSKKKTTQGGEVSQNPDPNKAAGEEGNELLSEARWFRERFGNYPNARANRNGGTSQEDIDNYGKKGGNDGSVFGHPKKKRGYTEK